MFATNELFKTEKQPGIKAVDPEVMLGVTRKLLVSKEKSSNQILDLRYKDEANNGFTSNL